MARPLGTARTGGRQPGTPNKRTQELADRLAERMGAEWCPVVAMAEMTLDDDLKPEIKARLLAEIAPYLRPRVKPQVGDVEEEAGLAEAIQAARLRAVASSPYRITVVEQADGGFAAQELQVFTGVVGGLDGGDDARPEPASVPAPKPEPPPRLNLAASTEPEDRGSYADGDQYNPLAN